MYKINWEQFKVKNDDCRSAFETLSYHLFCRKFNIDGGIFAYKNQAGIETEPVMIEKQLVGFQAKFFDTTIDKKQVTDSIEKAKQKNKGLKLIYFYINKAFSESAKKDVKKSQLQNEIEEFSKNRGISIGWIVPSNLEILLNLSSNADLAQLYFGFGDEYGFVRSQCDPKITTYLQSDEYLSLPILDNNNKLVKNITKKVVNSSNEVFLLVGQPGSGKSLLFKKVFQELGGLEIKQKSGIERTILKNKLLPMLINLKDCSSDSLENIVRSRQNDYKLGNKDLGYIYLFDGLDELNEEKADVTLSYINNLAVLDKTCRKILISCRSGNSNRLKTNVYFPGIQTHRIDNLNIDFITKYFHVKKNIKKTQLLSKFLKSNRELVNRISDVFLIKLFWDTIDNLTLKSNIIDLLFNKVSLMLKDPSHKKNITELNLLNPKENELILINKEIAFDFQKKYQFRITLKELQNKIQELIVNLDNRSINGIVNYLIDMFFDGSSGTGGPDSFIYGHRRYQEYFLTLKLVEIFENEPETLRKLNILSNYEFLENIFLPYLRNKYVNERNLMRCIELNLIDLYLGNHRGWGADDPCYVNSSDFISSIASQNKFLTDQLFSDENLQLRQKIFINHSDILNDFKVLKANKDDRKASGNIRAMWEVGISELISRIVIFWKVKNYSLGRELYNNLVDIRGIYYKNRELEKLWMNDNVRDPYWLRWGDWLYIRIVVMKNDPKEIFDKFIRSNYESFSVNPAYSSSEEGKEKLLKSFLRVCLTSKVNINSIIGQFDDYEMISLLDILVSQDYMGTFISNKGLKSKISKYIKNYGEVNSEDKGSVLFYKKYFKYPLSNNEKNFAAEQIEKLLKDRQVDWWFTKTHQKMFVYNFALNQSKFSDLLSEKSELGVYYNPLRVFSALRIGHLEILTKKGKIESIIRDHREYVNLSKKYGGGNIKVDISFLYAQMISDCNVRAEKLILLKNIIFMMNDEVIPFSVLYNLRKINKSRFIEIVNESDLIRLEKELEVWEDDYPSYVDRCFELALMYSHIDNRKAIQYISKGINEGILRHGWRKDSIISDQLVEALEILLRNNWTSKDKAREYADKIFALTQRVRDITDGKGAWQGPYNLIDLLSKYDIEYAEQLKKRLREKEEYSNSSNMAVVDCLLGKIRYGYSFSDIEEGMNELRLRHLYQDKIDVDYFECKLKLYLDMSVSDFYSKNDQKKSFAMAYKQYEEIKENELQLRYGVLDKEDLELFIKLCEKYNKEYDSVIENKSVHFSKKVVFNEREFRKSLRNIKSKQGIRGLYKRLENYKKEMVLREIESWQLLLKATYKIDGNIQRFIGLLKRFMFPHTDFFTSNSKYFHLGVGVALNSIEMKEEMFQYLLAESGHGGFNNIMKCYEVLKNKKMCLNLFEHYLKFCHFLVY